jgi:hypothetical protein
VAWAPPAPVIEGAKSVKGREIVQSDQDHMLWLVGASIFGQRALIVSIVQMRHLTRS